MKSRSVILCVLLILGLALGGISVFAEEVKPDAVIPEGIPTEKVEENVFITLYQSVILFSEDRDYAVAPFSRFDVTEDCRRVALVFPSEGSTSVMLFDIDGGELEFIYGFEIALSETVAVRISGEHTVVWLKESGVIFALDRECEIVESGRLKSDSGDGVGSGDEATDTAVTLAEEFFGDGVSDRSTVGGIIFSVSDPTESHFGTLYGRLLMTDNDGSVTALYGTFDITKAGTAVTCAIAGVALLIASATVAVELIYIGKKKKTAASDVSEPSKDENV